MLLVLRAPIPSSLHAQQPSCIANMQASIQLIWIS